MVIECGDLHSFASFTVTMDWLSSIFISYLPSYLFSYTPFKFSYVEIKYLLSCCGARQVKYTMTTKICPLTYYRHPHRIHTLMSLLVWECLTELTITFIHNHTQLQPVALQTQITTLTRARQQWEYCLMRMLLYLLSA